MFRKALGVHQELGALDAMATAYGNLGAILNTRGDLHGAEAMHHRALEINEKLADIEGMATQYGNLGLVLHTRGNLDGARAYWLRTRDLFQQIGMPHMVARVQRWLDYLPDGGT